jgi:3-dehydroquinate dehydratase/shikimate dehydrogenase
MAKLCVTVTGRTMAELRRRRDEVTGADLVELRVDATEDPSATAALADRQRPVIFTCRAAWEGGHFKGSEEERQRLLADAQRLGAEYVDVEARAGFEDLIKARRGQGVVISLHDFDGVPTDLRARADAMRRTGAEIVKIAVAAHSLSDSVSLLECGATFDGKRVLLAMGDAGLPSRVLASRFGSEWTYAGDGVAPGQVPASHLRDRFGFDRIAGDTKIFGVVGKPVMHSLSPTIHNAAFRAADINAVYVPLAASDIDDFLRFADAIGLTGASVTAPYKLDAFKLAKHVDDTSRRVGAANTLRRCRSGGWDARNTDVEGFLVPLRSSVDVAGKRVTVLGAGGAARAVVDGLVSAGARVTISARNQRRAADVAGASTVSIAAWPPESGSWDVLVNTTPIGTTPDVDESPLPDGPFTGELVYDLVYNPVQTRLMRDAAMAGCQTIGGLDMLVAQAERQFEWWTGNTAPAGVMRHAALRTLLTEAP